jgi:hypothetical protein
MLVQSVALHPLPSLNLPTESLEEK